MIKMIKMILTTFVAVLLMMSMANVSVAAPVQWSVNGHYYDYVEATGLSWDQANAAASALEFNGMSGTLATILSADENTFLWNNTDIGGESWAYIGGYQDKATTEDDGWNWVTGETWSYTNWSVYEPNNGTSEGFLQLFTDGTWNNINNAALWKTPGDDYTATGYYVEYAPAPVPVPTTVWLLASGLLGLVGFRRKRNT